ncbi:hypothetical protein OK016_29490 [Vibrio chagasii]|nr:hypothetical protein [Vibrio chagasii]
MIGIVALGHPEALIKRIVVDGTLQKVTTQDSCFNCRLMQKAKQRSSGNTKPWRELLPAQKLQAHETPRIHFEVNDLCAINIMCKHIPDVYASRLRLFGTKSEIVRNQYE